jgi:nucleotide-binding universal stress UspA family protein
MYKTILVPIDLSHSAPGKAMINVAKRIGEEGAQIVLIYVVESIPTHVAVDLPPGVIEKSMERARKALEEIARDANVGASIEVRSGQPHLAILAEAEDRNADLIVVGSHRPGLQDYLLGSTAARVVRHATCAVLVQR